MYPLLREGCIVAKKGLMLLGCQLLLGGIYCFGRDLLLLWEYFVAGGLLLLGRSFVVREYFCWLQCIYFTDFLSFTKLHTNYLGSIKKDTWFCFLKGMVLGGS